MNKDEIKKALPLVVLALLLVPIATSSLLDIRQENIKEEEYRKLLTEQEAQKIAAFKAYLTGKFDPAAHEDFVAIPGAYTTLPYDMYLRKETWEAFMKMHAAAALDGVDLRIASAARNFDYQKGIWEKKWTGKTLVEGKNLAESMPNGADRFRKILEYSAAPGTSRHHWGTDMDIYYAVPEYFEMGKGKKIYDWLVAHAGEYGFCQVYDAKDNTRPAGYNEEKWHWSYMPLARIYMEEYKNLITENDINGFLGAEFVPDLNLIGDYVLGINPECL